MVECTGLENRRRAIVRGFESHSFRQRTIRTQANTAVHHCTTAENSFKFQALAGIFLAGLFCLSANVDEPERTLEETSRYHEWYHEQWSVPVSHP